jgi:hypothetical protein
LLLSPIQTADSAQRAEQRHGVRRQILAPRRGDGQFRRRIKVRAHGDDVAAFRSLAREGVGAREFNGVPGAIHF